MKTKIKMSDSNYITVKEVFRDDDIYVERFQLIDIEGADEVINSQAWVTKTLGGEVINQTNTKPEWLIRQEKIIGLFSRLS